MAIRYRFNIFTGKLDIIDSGSAAEDNFSYTCVEEDKVLCIPDCQQMPVHDTSILVDGELKVDGEIYFT